MHKAAVLVPALDCERTIGDVVRAARQYADAVLVVDDGSADATAARARAAGAEVVSHPRNLGKGMALRTGLRGLAERGFTHAVAMDGDGQHLADQIPALLAVSRDEPRALVIGARRVEGSD